MIVHFIHYICKCLTKVCRHCTHQLRNEWSFDEFFISVQLMLLWSLKNWVCSIVYFLCNEWFCNVWILECFLWYFFCHRQYYVILDSCVGKLTFIGSDSSLSSGQCQAIIWTNVQILIIGLLGTNFSEILMEISINTSALYWIGPRLYHHNEDSTKNVELRPVWVPGLYRLAKVYSKWANYYWVA